MKAISMPLDLFRAISRYLLERAPTDQGAEGLYNGMVIAFANQQAHEGGSAAPDIISAPEASDIVGRGDPAA